jgi:multidrug efflux pump subunit AcrB
MTIAQGSLGPAGRIAAAFLHSRLTPLSILTSILLGLMALAALPREEEPQIQVPMVDISLAWPGTPVEQVERQLTTPVERRLWEIPGLEYLYSTSRQDGALLIARFKVSSNPEEALVRVRTRLDEAMADLPPGSMIANVSPRSIDDVPVLALTLWNRSGLLDASDIRNVASELAIELRKTSGVARVRVLGGEPRQVRILPDPIRMASAGVTVSGLSAALEYGGLSLPAGLLIGEGTARPVRTEAAFRDVDDIRSLLVPSASGAPVRLSDLAEVIDGPAEPRQHVFFGDGEGRLQPAVTVEVSKRPGQNATVLVHTLLQRVDELKPRLTGSDIAIETTRNYGETAKHKSDDLIFHLLLATLSVVALIAFALGRREAVVVAVAIPVTLALTLFVYSFLGYTLNRVTLFALIFSIGILVDDAIVVVENIARHFIRKDSRTVDLRVVHAVDEVGNPTILATMTVIAAILPLAFVGGLMGPYMKPIPIGASIAMIFSLAVAFIVSPWAARRVLKSGAAVSDQERHGQSAGQDHQGGEGRLDRIYRSIMDRLLSRAAWTRLFLAGIVLLLAGAVSLLALRFVAVKILPFDNKSEFEIVLDMPPGTALENTLAAASEIARRVSREPDVENVVLYAGLAAPVTFNGLVRHYDLRMEPRYASLLVNLAEAKHRKRQSHAIAREVRPVVEKLAAARGARVKVVEVPPGPPVISTLVAEVYGPDLEGQRRLAHQVWNVFRDTPGVVDADLLLAESEPMIRLDVDRERAALAGVSPGQVSGAIRTLFSGQTVGTLRAPSGTDPVPITVQLSAADMADLSALGALRLGSGAGTPISELVRPVRTTSEPEIYHKNLHRVVYVLGDVAGREESPVYAIAALRPKIDALNAPDGNAVQQLSTVIPSSDESYSLKWDGEWHITYEVFRDMGIAFAVVLVLIYVLTVGWFRSFVTPFVIMIPIPLSLVGILPLHALLGAYFTATSMIGFIAGAGITVRNSIILVDFIELRLAEGYSLKDAVIDAGAVRFRPMLLTAAAVIVGGGVIVFDPIFQGLAVSLIGGEVASTLLSRMAVPVLYYLARRRSRERATTPLPAAA